MCFKKKSLSACNEESTVLWQTPKYTESLKVDSVFKEITDLVL